MMITDEPCLCGATSYTCLYNDTFKRLAQDYLFSLLECNTCKTVRVLPIPDISLYTHGYGESTSISKEYIPREKPWCLNLSIEIEQLLFKNPELKNKPVIDIGCNGGELVEALIKRNIQAEGCDVDVVAIEYGLHKNLPLFVKDLSAQPLDKKYGLIMMNHTLEHIISARPFMTNICNSLTEGGILQIHVPNYNGWIARYLKADWGFLAPQEHVWQFTPQTLKAFVESCLPGQIKATKINCKSSLEICGGKSPKSLIKRVIIYLSTFFNQGDEIIATFKKM